MTATPDPTAAARTLWEHLVDWQPATAAALIEHCRALPDDWPLRVFGVGRPAAALALPPGAQDAAFLDDQPPEIPPYSDNEWEGCPACIERGANCRYHEGYATGYQDLHKPLLEAVKDDKAATIRVFLDDLGAAEESTP